jgi:DNA-nicking Smr family endonuclease
MRRAKSLTDHDRATWASYVRAVNPLAGRARPELPPAPTPEPQEPHPAIPQTKPKSRSSQAASPLVTGMHPPGLDKASWNRFRAGKLAPARTLDLHGKTAQAAYHALERFLHAAQLDHLRCVEIITGRGQGENGGVIRRELPMWLNLPAFRPMILATAHPHAANPGSVRVLLRRPRA